MIFKPEKYALPDVAHQAFIDTQEIEDILMSAESTPSKVRAVIRKAQDKQRLSLHEQAILLQTKDEQLIEEIKEGAARLKDEIYGKRVVLFAPLYVGNLCANDCVYCGFKSSNQRVERLTLDTLALQKEVESLLAVGHKRLVLAYGEHPKYDAHYIAQSIRDVYAVRKGKHFIRRVNVNAAPFDVAGFKTIGEAGIGTYQIFQETYHRASYEKVHLKGKKRDFDWRLTAFDRAMEAGIDDWGLGILLGLYDWRFELMGLLRHVNHLEAVYNIGPHTLSFPRLQDASEFGLTGPYYVNDADFEHLVAVLRLSVPYAGLILTAREPAPIRKSMLRMGISQIDGGSNIELGAYSKKRDTQDIHREQFVLNDTRSLEEVIEELLEEAYLPSFCTSCYEKGRTGEHFMEFSVPGFIKRFCQPNALGTLQDYLVNFASPELRKTGQELIKAELNKMPDDVRLRIEKSLARVSLTGDYNEME